MAEDEVRDSRGGAKRRKKEASAIEGFSPNFPVSLPPRRSSRALRSLSPSLLSGTSENEASTAPWKSKNEALKASRVRTAGGDFADEEPGFAGVAFFAFAAAVGGEEPALRSWRGGMVFLFPWRSFVGRSRFQKSKGDRSRSGRSALAKVQSAACTGRSEFFLSSAAALRRRRFFSFAGRRFFLFSTPRSTKRGSLHSEWNAPLELKLLVKGEIEVSPRRLRREKGGRGPGRPARRGGGGYRVEFFGSFVERRRRRRAVGKKVRSPEEKPFRFVPFFPFFSPLSPMTQPAPQPLPVARFVGAASVGKKRLVRALLSQQSAERSSGGISEAAQGGDDGEESGSAIGGDNNIDPGSPRSSSSRSSLWELDTRYYTARLSLERSRIAGEEEEEEEGGEGEENGEAAAATAAAAAAEAVVLVFDPAREGTFAAAARWWSSRSSKSGSDSSGDLLSEPAVKLCVAHGGEDNGDGDGDGDGDGESSSSLRREAEAWCVENAFELIEVSSSSLPSSSSSSSSPEKEAGGISRLRDALAAHTWPGLVRKAPEEVEAARRAAVAEAERRRRRTQKGGGGEEEGEDGDDDDDAYAPPPLPPLPLAAPEDDDDLLLLASAAPAAPAPTGFEAACRGAAGVEGLEELFRSLSAARAAAAAASGAALSDEERRERAAAVALRLAEVLGLEDDGEEESDDDSDREEAERRRRSEV